MLQFQRYRGQIYSVRSDMMTNDVTFCRLSKHLGKIRANKCDHIQSDLFASIIGLFIWLNKANNFIFQFFF